MVRNKSTSKFELKYCKLLSGFVLSKCKNGTRSQWFFLSRIVVQFKRYLFKRSLTHWGRVTHICFSKLTIIGTDNGLSPGWRQAIFWTNVGILLIGPLGTNFSEILIEIYIFSFKKMLLKMSSGKWWPSCLGLNVLISSLDLCLPRKLPNRLPHHPCWQLIHLPLTLSLFVKLCFPGYVIVIT